MIKGLYVHIPFCSHICAYCDFAKAKYTQSLSDKYLAELFKEIGQIQQSEFESIYIGGGTPSSLSYTQLETLLTVLARFKVTKEYTVEINPENFDLKKAQILKKFGVNRVSIGVESFDDGLLMHMSRAHKEKDVYDTIQYLEEVGIKNRSIDLIYGFANQTLAMLLMDLQKAVNLPVTHISIYGLEVYPTTLFGMKNYKKVDDETDYLMYSTIIEYLNTHSYIQYETSNFAFGPYQSHHNRLYWKYEDFIGVGLGASGKINGVRYDNTTNFVKYLRAEHIEEETRLSLDEQRFEAIMMNLRLCEGIDINEFDRRFETNLLDKYHQAIEKNINEGLLEVVSGHLKTTEKGLFVLNDILVDFMD